MLGSIFLPLYIWGLAATGIVCVPKSAIVAYKIHKKDIDAYKEISSNKKYLLRSILIDLIPIYNVINPIVKLFFSTNVLASHYCLKYDNWKDKTNKRKAKFNKFISKFKKNKDEDKNKNEKKLENVVLKKENNNVVKNVNEKEFSSVYEMSTTSLIKEYNDLSKKYINLDKEKDKDLANKINDRRRVLYREINDRKNNTNNEKYDIKEVISKYNLVTSKINELVNSGYSKDSKIIKELTEERISLYNIYRELSSQKVLKK